MIYFPLNVKVGQTVALATYGSYVYYESGSAGVADSTIKVVVQGSSGAEFILKVGQGFRLKSSYTGLLVSSYKNEADIIGNLVFADSEFFDNRVVGTVNVSGTVQTQETGLQYGASFSSFGGKPSGSVQIVAPVANVNGVVVHQSYMNHEDAGNGGTVSLVAKAGAAPVNINEGDILNISGGGIPVFAQNPIKIAPGKGLYLFESNTATGGSRTVLYTVL